MRSFPLSMPPASKCMQQTQEMLIYATRTHMHSATHSLPQSRISEFQMGANEFVRTKACCTKARKVASVLGTRARICALLCQACVCTSEQRKLLGIPFLEAFREVHFFLHLKDFKGRRLWEVIPATQICPNKPKSFPLSSSFSPSFEFYSV